MVHDYIKMAAGMAQMAQSMWPEKNRYTHIREEKKVGRNEPCPCKSGKKYKNCCEKNLVK